MTIPDATRARDLKLIHTARRHMAWDDHTYRAILQRVTGKDSAADLTAKQRKAVIDEFCRLGWRIKSSKSHRNPSPPSSRRGGSAGAGVADADLLLTGPGWGKDRLIAKIGALLAEAGRGWAYADGCARKMCGVESIRFCSDEQLRRIVAALMYDQKRRQRRNPPTPPEVA